MTSSPNGSRRSATTSRGTYGWPRVHAQLRRDGVHVGRQAGGPDHAPTWPDRSVPATVDEDHHRRPGSDARSIWLKRAFGPGTVELDRVYVGDITYIWTWEGWAYLATVIDLASRRVVGWALADHMRAELVCDALRMAIAHRRPAPGLIFHSDRGTQYTADLFASACSRRGITQSTGRAGSCFDNAAAESFFSTLEWELFRRTPLATKQAARRGVAWFIDWYNQVRRHSSCEMTSPSRSRRSSPPEPAKPSQRRRRRENRPPESPESAATRSGGTRHRADDRLNQQSAALHDSGGGPCWRGPAGCASGNCWISSSTVCTRSPATAHG